MAEARPGEWYLYMERPDSMMQDIDWLKNADGYGPFESEEDAARFLETYFNETQGYWTQGYDASRELTTREEMLIRAAPSATAEVRRKHMKTIR